MVGGAEDGGALVLVAASSSVARPAPSTGSDASGLDGALGPLAASLTTATATAQTATTATRPKTANDTFLRGGPPRRLSTTALDAALRRS